MKLSHFSMFTSALAMTMAASYLQAAPIKDSSTEMDQASQAAVTVYRNKGNPGLQQAIADCYKSVGYATPFCVYMDVAGREIDFSVAQAYKELGQNVAPHAYFQSKAFGERVASFYILHRQTRKESNEHMQKIQPQIKKRVEKILFLNG